MFLFASQLKSLNVHAIFFEPSSMIWIHSKNKTIRTRSTKQFAQLWRNYKIACDLQEGMDKKGGHTTDVNRERHFLSLQHIPMGSGGGFRECRENLAKGWQVRSTAIRDVIQLIKDKSSTRRRTGSWINRRVRHRTQNYPCKLRIQFVKRRTNQIHERDRDQGRLAERKCMMKDSELTLKMAIDMKKVQRIINATVEQIYPFCANETYVWNWEIKNVTHFKCPSMCWRKLYPILVIDMNLMQKIELTL